MWGKNDKAGGYAMTRSGSYVLMQPWYRGVSDLFKYVS